MTFDMTANIECTSKNYVYETHADNRLALRQWCTSLTSAPRNVLVCQNFGLILHKSGPESIHFNQQKCLVRELFTMISCGVLPITVWMEGQYQPRTTGSVTWLDISRRSSLSFTKKIFDWGCRRRCTPVGQFLHKYLSKKVVILRQILGYFGSLDLTQYSEKVLQTTACRHNPACEAISSSCNCILSLIRKLCFKDKFVHLVECNIFRNNHIT